MSQYVKTHLGCDSCKVSAGLKLARIADDSVMIGGRRLVVVCAKCNAEQRIKPANMLIKAWGDGKASAKLTGIHCDCLDGFRTTGVGLEIVYDGQSYQVTCEAGDVFQMRKDQK